MLKERNKRLLVVIIAAVLIAAAVVASVKIENENEVAAEVIAAEPSDTTDVETVSEDEEEEIKTVAASEVNTSTPVLFKELLYKQGAQLYAYYEYTYTEDGKVAEKVLKQSYDDSIISASTFTYEEESYTETIANADGETTEAKVYDYADNLITDTRYDAENGTDMFSYSYDVNNEEILRTYTKDGYTITYLTGQGDSEGRITKSTEYTASGALYHTNEFSYNELGQLENISIYDADGELYEKYTYTYNDEGRIALMKDVWEDYVNTKEYIYDEKGNVIYINESDANGQIGAIEYNYNEYNQLTFYCYTDVSGDTEVVEEMTEYVYR